MLALPLFYFPTKIISIDDDPEFNENLNLALEKNYCLETYDRPKAGLNFFRNYSPFLSRNSFLKGFTEHEYYDTINHVPVSFDIASLVDLAKNEEKYNEVSTLIVDYDMPGMNGLELCKKLSDLPIKKILLTGHADHTKAVTAFNEKLIDFFIIKGQEKLMDHLKAYLRTLEKQYFIEHTSNLRETLEADHALPLSDPIFIDFFNNWIMDNNIKEFYLIDKNGSFLLINNRKEKQYFIVYGDSSLSKFIQSYEEGDVVSNYIESIKRRERIPFFGIGVSPDTVDQARWKHYLHRPEIIEGKERYYWHCISEELFKTNC